MHEQKRSVKCVLTFANNAVMNVLNTKWIIARNAQQHVENMPKSARKWQLDFNLMGFVNMFAKLYVFLNLS